MRYLVVPLLALLCGSSWSAAADWPGFRGPFGNGVSAEKDFPLTWGPKENLAWKVPLPGPGTSSPIICGERVFVTCFTGTMASELVRHVLCFDRQTGHKHWQRDFPAPLPENDYKRQVLQHGLTTSTPVTDGQRLFVYFGRGGLFAFDFEGRTLWQADLGDTISVFGSGASPITLDDMVIVNASMEGRHLVALDKSSGKILWKSEINGMSWSMPLVVDLGKGKKEIVLNVGAGLYGFDSRKGTELWSVDIVAGYNSSTPVVRDGIVYVMNQGVGEKEFVAVRAGGRGDVTKTHVVWRQTKAGASYCSPLLKGDRLFYFSGQANVVRAGDGQLVKKKALAGVTNLYGSPILAGDKIVLFTRNQGAYVLSADDKLDVLAHNDLADDSNFNASPALAGGWIFMRSNQFLYCIGTKQGKK